ncbi:lrrc40, partial [Symbiodinium microadriaticum]
LSLDGNPIRAIRRSLLSQSTTDLKTYLRTRGPPLNGQIQATLLPSGFAADKDGVYGVSVAGVDGTGVVQMESHIVNRLRQISGGNLDLSGLQLVNMPSGWLTFVERTESIDSTDLSISLTTLNLSDNAFVDIPIDLVRDARLSPRSLDISANCLGRGLTERSDGCPLYPPSLSSLDAAKNGLTVGHMKALLSGNKRDGSCSLSRLMLSHNVITGMPSGSKGYRGLRELQISFNKLTTLENVDFSQFQHLEILDISNNKILSLGCIYDVSSLRTLLLDNNELDAIPYQLCFLKNLQSLSIHGNPQRTVRQGVIQKGTEAIIA